MTSGIRTRAELAAHAGAGSRQGAGGDEHEVRGEPERQSEQQAPAVTVLLEKSRQTLSSSITT